MAYLGISPYQSNSYTGVRPPQLSANNEIDGPTGTSTREGYQGQQQFQRPSYENPENPGRAWRDPSTDPASFFNPGNGPAGLYVQNAYGVAQPQLDAAAKRRAMLEGLASNAQGVASSPQMQAAYQQAALGTAPSSAEAMLAQSMGQSMRDQLLLAGSAKGGVGQRVGAMEQAQQNLGQMQSSGAAQLAALRAQEMAQARGQYLQNQEFQGRQALGYYGMSQDQLEREYARRAGMGQYLQQAGEAVRTANQTSDNQRLSAWMSPISGVVGGAVSGLGNGLMRGFMGGAPGAAGAPQPASGTWV